MGICVYMTIWHMCGYLQCCENLARVRVQALIKQVSFRDRTLIYRTDEESHDYHAISGTMSGERFQQLVGNQL